MPKIYQFPDKNSKLYSEPIYQKALLSTNIDVINAAITLAKKDKDLTPTDRSFLDRRLNATKKVNKISAVNLNAKNQPPKGKKKSNIIISSSSAHKLNVKFNEAQRTTYGCWSVSLRNLLLYHGVDFTQEEIRSIRPNFSEEKIENIIEARFPIDDKSKTEWEQLNKDTMGNVFAYSDLILKTLPNTGIRNVIYSPVNSNNYEAVKNDIFQIVENAIMDKREPVSFLGGDHYRTITGFDRKNKKFYVADSAGSGKDRWVKVEELIGKNNAQLELTWFEPLTIDKKGQVSGLPENFKGISYVNGNVFHGAGYEKLESNFSNVGIAVSSCEQIENKSADLHVKREQYMAPASLVIPQTIANLQKPGKDNPANGKTVLTADDMTTNILRKSVLAAAADLTTGDIYHQMYKFAKARNIKISFNQTDMHSFENALSRYLAEYTNVSNRDSSSYYTRLNNELEHLCSFKSILPDTPANVETKKLIDIIAQGKDKLLNARKAMAAFDARQQALDNINEVSKLHPYYRFGGNEALIANEILNVKSGPAKAVDDEFAINYLENLFYADIAEQEDVQEDIAKAPEKEPVVDVNINNNIQAEEQNIVIDINDTEEQKNNSIQDNPEIEKKSPELSDEASDLLQKMTNALSSIEYSKIKIDLASVDKDTRLATYSQFCQRYTHICYDTIIDILKPKHQFSDIRTLILNDKVSEEEFKAVAPEEYRDYYTILKTAIEFDNNNFMAIQDTIIKGMYNLEKMSVTAEDTSLIKSLKLPAAGPKYLAKYKDNHEKAEYCSMQIALNDNMRTYTPGPRWAKVLKQKPGMTLEKMAEIDRLAHGPEQNVGALADLFIKELMSMPIEKLDEYTLDGMYENCRELDYYGRLAMEIENVFRRAGDDLYKYYSKEQLDEIKGFGTNLFELYSDVTNLATLYCNPVSKLVNIHSMSNDQVGEVFAKSLQITGNGLSTVQKFCSNLYAYYNNCIDREECLDSIKKAYHTFAVVSSVIPQPEEVDFSGEAAEALPSEQIKEQAIAKFENLNKLNGHTRSGLYTSGDTYAFGLYLREIEKIKGNDSSPGRLTVDKINSLQTLNEQALRKLHEYVVANTEPGKAVTEKMQLFLDLEKSLKMDRDILNRAKTIASVATEPKFFRQLVLEAKKALLIERNVNNERIEKAEKIFNDRALDAVTDHYNCEYSRLMTAQNDKLAENQKDYSKKVRNAINEFIGYFDSHVEDLGLSDKSERVRALYNSLVSASRNSNKSINDLRKSLIDIKPLAEAVLSSKDDYVAGFAGRIVKLANFGVNGIDINYNNHVRFATSTAVITNSINQPNVVYSNSRDKAPKFITNSEELRNDLVAIRTRLRGAHLTDGQRLRFFDTFTRQLALDKYNKEYKAHKATAKALGIQEDNVNISQQMIDGYVKKLHESTAITLMMNSWDFQTHSVTKMNACYDACLKYEKTLEKMRFMSVEQLQRVLDDLGKDKGSYIHKSGVKAFDKELTDTVKAYVENKLAEKQAERYENTRKLMINTNANYKISDPSTIRDNIVNELSACFDGTLDFSSVSKVLFSESIYNALCKKYDFETDSVNADISRVPNYRDPVAMASQFAEDLSIEFVNDKQALADIAPFIVDGSISELFNVKVGGGDFVTMQKLPTKAKCLKWATEKREASVKNAGIILDAMQENANKYANTYIATTYQKGISAMEYFAKNVAPKDLPITRVNSGKIVETMQAILKARVMSNYLKKGLSEIEANEAYAKLLKTDTIAKAMKTQNVNKTVNTFLEKDGIDSFIKLATKEAKEMEKAGPVK